MTDPLQLARECGADVRDVIDDDNAEFTVAEFTAPQLSTLIDRVREEAAREQREKDAAICSGKIALLETAASHLADDEYGAKCCVEGRKQQAHADAAAILAQQEQEGTNANPT